MTAMQTAAIIGLGLIGGSIAKALRQKAGFRRITAVGRSEAPLRQALSDGVIDAYATDMRVVDRETDIVFICTPVSITVEMIHAVRPLVKDDCIITDAGSTKDQIVRAAEAAGCQNFIGGHPMAGSEQSGYAAATEALFENAYYLLTPAKGCDKEKTAALRDLVTRIGAIPVVLDAARHDHIVAAISHLPHIIAASLVNTVAEADDSDRHMHTLAAGGFKDITRIASSDTAMWQSICRENRAEILALIERFQDQIGRFAESIQTDQLEDVWHLFSRAKTYRNSFAARGSSAYIKEYALTVDILDKPGSIATIATLLSVNHINIKNIGINNNREQQAGVLRVLFETETDYDRSKQLLRAMNYKVFD